MKRKKEFQLGLLFIVALGLLGWGISYLKGSDILFGGTRYYAVYNHIQGLLVANPVTVNGYEVGQVTDIDFTSREGGNVVVEMEVEEDIDIPKNSIARIYSSDLMGSKAVAIDLGKGPQVAAHGDTLSSSVESGIKEAVNKQVQPIKQKAEDLLLSVDTVVTAIQTVFKPSSREKISNSLSSIENTLQYMESTTYNLDTLMKSERSRLSMIVGNIENITRNLASKETQINHTLDNLSAISDTLAGANISKTLHKTNKSLKQLTAIITKINEGEGTAGMLINNDTLYRNLQSASHELNMLMRDMKLNPGRYVHFSIFGRGKKQNEYVPPEKQKQPKEKKQEQQED
ncbi:MAG: MlaD family protein [Bacteroidales bacterium]|nr:MlaD family protein [Bacteroidales bacterium]MCF8332992.1 MlaD family protein [Bacteroidales bacterium]